MDKSVMIFIFFSSWPSLILCQYDHQRGNQPPASILLHKQALGQDGSFNYAFAADNGLQQGEIINPDGSRRGSYSYVDPNGKTVSLSYTAGKDGFRVLNGDHVPRSPEPQRQGPQHEHYRQQPQVPARQNYYPAPGSVEPVPYEYYKNSVNAPSYRGRPLPHEEPYLRQRHPLPLPPHSGPGLVPHYEQIPSQPFQGAPAQAFQGPPAHPPQAPHYQPRQYRVQEGNYEKPSQYVAQYQSPPHHQQQPQKPHSFGNGFAFEFGGK